jgi:hypothetical protein
MMRSRKACLALFAVALAASAGAEEYFVVGVAQRKGQDGTWWNTEVWVSNTSASSGGYSAVFLPVGKSNLAGLRAEAALEDLRPGETALRKDLVPEGELGVLRIVTTPGVVVYCRVFNAAGRGSFGLGMPAQLRSDAVKPGEIAHLLGLRRTPQFRTNMGLFNPTVDNGQVRIRLVGEHGEVVGEQPYSLAPGGYLQLTDVLHAFGVSRGENLRAEVTGTVPFFAYASVVDTRSGAPTYVAPLR